MNWRSRFTFTFVRNPFDRLVSLCAKVHECYNGRALTVARFRSWVAEGMPDTRVAQHADSPRMRTPQYEYLHDKAGRLLVDFVGRYEALSEGVVQVCVLLGVPVREIPQINTSSRIRDYRPYYDAPTRDIAAALYAADLAAWYTNIGVTNHAFNGGT
ncbi:MAG: sulfotransferase family 2 domain-containing protein [Planctomycetota bacterium]